MKKFLGIFYRFSLTRQLCLLLGSIFILIILFIHPYINAKIETITDSQIMNSVISSQQQLIDLVENVDKWTTEDRFTINRQLTDKRIKHLLYYKDVNQIETLTDYSKREVYYYFDDIFFASLESMISNNQVSYQGKVQLTDQQDIFFYITESQTVDDIYWISFLQSDLTTLVLKETHQEIKLLVNFLYLVVLLVAFVLIVWIYSIIHSLKSIGDYIVAIQENKPYQFTLNRHDEIGDVGRALVEMDMQLKEQQQLQEDMIHNISHDLKTPITIIKSYSESMKEDIYPYGDKNASLDVIIENTERLDKKVKDFLLLNRLDYIKNNQNHLEKTNMKQMIETVINHFQPIYPNLTFEMNMTNCEFVGESEHWLSCITNLVENAIRYAQSIIHIELNENEFTIFNDGELIDEMLIKELFKPYQKGPKGNFGLGLSIVYKIVSMYDYQIEAVNKGNGVLFRIYQKKDPSE